MKVLYFTATGNNLYIAKRLGGERYSIPKLLKEGILDIEDDKIGIVFPVFYGGVPKIVEEFLDKAKLKGSYIFAIASYGAFPMAATNHLLEIGRRNGVEFSYVNEILMIDNYLPVFEMDKQLKKEKSKKIEQNLDMLVQDIKAGKKYIKKHSFIEQSFRNFQIKSYDHHFEKNFVVNEACNGCKVCEQVCPVENIHVLGKPVFEDHCQHCLACAQNCPQGAIHMKNERSKARFRNRNVTLKEIIEANK